MEKKDARIGMIVKNIYGMVGEVVYLYDFNADVRIGTSRIMYPYKDLAPVEDFRKEELDIIPKRGIQTREVYIDGIKCREILDIIGFPTWEDVRSFYYRLESQICYLSEQNGSNSLVFTRHGYEPGKRMSKYVWLSILPNINVLRNPIGIGCILPEEVFQVWLTRVKVLSRIMTNTRNPRIKLVGRPFKYTR